MQLLIAMVVLIAGIGTARAQASQERTGVPQSEPPGTVLITGASRGIGLEFAREYARRGWNVLATCRNPQQATALQQIAQQHPRVTIERLDVTDFAAVDALAEKYRGTPIDVLLNNAAISAGLANETLGALRYDLFEQVLRTNTIAPLKMAEAFLEHVAASRQRKIVTVTSSQGSISELRGGRLYLYRSSKTAVNMVMANLAVDVRPRGIIVGLVAPGATDTDLMRGLPLRMRKAEDSARTMLERIEAMTLEDSGRFLSWDGRSIGW